ncbi:MAG: ABC transporter permease [Lachnospiraceae bacterium]|nr:ABC transporter permease [Lachnospiraceae bacterium]
MRYYARRILGFIVTIFLVSVFTFAIFQILPGDPATVILGVDADPAQLEALRASMGMDKPMVERYLDWVAGLFQGDMGTSYKYQQPVAQLIQESFKVTASLAFVSIILTVLIGLPVGIWLAKNSRKPVATPVSMLSQISLSIPAFCMSIFLIYIFCVKLQILPSFGYTPLNKGVGKWLKNLILPSMAIALGSSAALIRYIYTSINAQMKEDYIKTAKSKGVSMTNILNKHVLRNSLIPVITILGMLVSDILGGSIIIENVFSFPGIGKLLSVSISSRDFPLIQGLVVYMAGIVVLCNFLVDMLYSVIDPRIRLK